MMTAGIHVLQADAGYSQTIENTYVAISARRAPLKLIFLQIEQQTHFLFTYPPELVDRYSDVSIDTKNRSVKEVLDLITQNSNLNYRESKGNIIIYVPEEREYNKKQHDGMNVSGKVIDKAGNPVAGVYVMVKNTNRGTVTDAGGNYVIDAKSNDWLIFSFIGYKRIEIQVGDRIVIDQVMEEDQQSLQEVVINAGYYQTTDKTTTGNIVRISGKEINDIPVTSPLMSLQGRVAGLEITPVNGAPGGAPKIRIRGENSLRRNGGYPLYVVDGVIVDSAPISSQSLSYGEGIDPLTNINPENIESIEILKDADATAIYGSRGANGVVLVTTKKAKQSGSHVSAQAYRGIGKISHTMDLLDTKEYIQMRREAFKDAGLDPSPLYDYDLTRWDTTKYTDWQKELLGGSSDITDFQVSLDGGNATTTFRLGGNYHKETMIMSDKLGFRNATAFASFNHRSEDNRLSVGFSANYGVSDNRFVDPNTFIQQALTLPPNAPDLYLPDGSLNWDILDYGPYKLSAFNNPMAEMLKINKNQNRTLIANTQIGYEILNGLHARAALGYTSNDGTESIINPIAALAPVYITSQSRGTALFGTSRRNSWLIEPQLSWSKKMGKGFLEALIGSTFQGSLSRRQDITASGYNSDLLLNSLRGATGHYYSADDHSEYRYAAIFGRVGYNYDGKYFINFTGRRDGSSRFGPGNQFGNFGAVGGAWVFSKEKLIMENAPVVSFGKIRSSYGVTGNDQIGDYQYYNLLGISSSTYQRNVTLSPVGLFNRNFNWESTRKFEASLELGLFDDRISIQGAWFKNRSSNQLIDYQLPATTGFASILSNFDATVENRGWEFNIQSRNLNFDKFRWTTSINLTVSRNELVSFPGIESSPYKDIYKVGSPLSIQYLYIWKGVDPQTGHHRVEDRNEDGLFNNEDQILSESLATRYYGGVTNSLQIGSFDVSFLVQFSRKNTVGWSWDHPGATLSNQPIEVLNRWKKEGDQTDVSKYSGDFMAVYYYRLALSSNYNIIDGSFIKLKNISISYNLPSSLIEPLKISNCRVFLQGQNLLTITNFIGLDPETGNSQPQLMMITGGASVKF
ncbi:SusC/RagA family TonB-linked outer membrane protein [Dawidia soli]|uniref:SusC/RagA family TonB-linked outer membrane protein n=1 Tax=Dawidia soli TaxID=2782352 RepID=A0AAP2DEQ7_9BACT|nr:SusC/RagA family TonB-linked outer membrane protein [Dawidia soli]MBT1690663.1 SusC/RagA family TonB-linked outer membrane protein [Dawidia soli]